MEIKLPKYAIILIILGAFLILVSGILTLVIHTKTSFAKEAMAKIKDMGGQIILDKNYYSRGAFYDFLDNVCQKLDYNAEMGHRAYHVVMKNEKFDDQSMILANGIPHLKSLHLESSHITDKALNNLHGSNLLEEIKLINIKCSKKGLDELPRFKNLKKLTLASLDYIKASDFDFVKKLQLESLILRDIHVNPLGFSQRNKLPEKTKLVVENPRSP